MASGSAAGRPRKSGSKGSFDFASDDILCSYEDYDNHHLDSSNGNLSDSVIGTNSTKDFQKSRVSRSSVFPTSSIYTHPEGSLNQEVMETVENTMKKYSDNLMRFLEGISSRLSQLELYCYNLDKSIGEMRSELGDDNKEADAKLKSLDKHIQEVHRSVQILRDKQELAETQKELAKLQLAQKDEKSTTPASESKRSEDGPEVHNQQLALALPNQVAPQQPSLPTRPTEQPHPGSIAASSQMTSQTLTQPPPYYLPTTPMPNPSTQHQPQPQPPQGSPYATADPQYRTPQMAPIPQQGQVTQLPPQMQQFPQYQQQWPQSVPQPPAQPAQAQVRPPPSNVYPAYIQNPPQQEQQQQMNPSVPMQMPPQMPTSMPMQMPQHPASRADVGPYGYGGPSRQPQTQAPPQPMKGGPGPGPGTGGDGYPPPISSSGSYMMYDSEGGRPHSHHPPPQSHFSQGGYPPHPQPPPSSSHMIRGPAPSQPQYVRNNPYNELIDKLVSMGYRGDHVASVIQRLEETGQPVDFNSVLDRLNGHSSGSGSSQRGW